MPAKHSKYQTISNSKFSDPVTAYILGIVRASQAIKQQEDEIKETKDKYNTKYNDWQDAKKTLGENASDLIVKFNEQLNHFKNNETIKITLDLKNNKTKNLIAYNKDAGKGLQAYGEWTQAEAQLKEAHANLHQGKKRLFCTLLLGGISAGLLLGLHRAGWDAHSFLKLIKQLQPNRKTFITIFGSAIGSAILLSKISHHHHKERAFRTEATSKQEDASRHLKNARRGKTGIPGLKKFLIEKQQKEQK